MTMLRIGRIVGAALLLVPSLALGQAALQQPATSGSPDSIPVALNKLYANDLFLQSLIGSRFGQLGNAAFLNVGAVTGTVADGGALAVEITRAQAAEALKAPLASPALTGVPTAPTAAAGTGTNQIATTQFVAIAVAGGGGGGGGGGVPTSRQILTSGLAAGGGDLTADRTITVPIAAQSDVASGLDNTKALTAFSVAARFNLTAPLASPAFTGAPTAPTATAGANTTQVATLAFANTAASNAAASATANTLQFTPQTITPAQQGQARSNIATASLNFARTSAIRQSKTAAAPLTLWDTVADDFQTLAGVDAVNSVNAALSGDTIVNQLADANTKALLHFEGANNSTTISDDVPGHAWAVVSNAKISTAQAAFGSSSLLITGGTDAGVSVANTDFHIGTGNYTFNLRVRPTSSASGALIDTRGSGGGAGLYAYLNGSNQISVFHNGVTLFTTSAAVPLNAWSDIEIDRSGATVYAFIGGTLAGSSPNAADDLGAANVIRIGNGYDGSAPQPGYYDEFRFRNAVTHTAAFTSAGAPFSANVSGNLDLRSVAFAAQAVPNRASIFLLVKPTSGTLTPNTNLTASFSRDNGTTWGVWTLGQVGTLGGYTVLEADGLDVSAQPSAASPKYRVQTTDPSLVVAIDAVAVDWR